MGPNESTFYRLGGTAGIDRIVAGFYDRVLADAELAPFFVHADVAHLLSMQREYIATALGGPVTAATTAVHDAHAGRGITAKHYMRFLDLFLATIRDADLDQRDIDLLLERMALAAPDVIDETSEDG